jgi:hypothetical protein
MVSTDRNKSAVFWAVWQCRFCYKLGLRFLDCLRFFGIYFLYFLQAYSEQLGAGLKGFAEIVQPANDIH